MWLPYCNRPTFMSERDDTGRPQCYNSATSLVVTQMSKIISADSHVAEPVDLWLKYIEPAYHERAPRVACKEDTDYFICEGIETRPVGIVAPAGKPSNQLNRRARYSENNPGGWDPHYRVKDMARDGIEAEVIYPSLGMRMYNIPDPSFQQASFRAYNDWLCDYCSTYPKQLYGMGLIPLDDVEQGILELQRVAKKGMKGALIKGGQIQGKEYHDPCYEPFWAAAEEIGLPITLHSFTGPQMPYEFMVRHTLAPHQFQTSICLMLFSGVLERYPKLQFVSAENDIGWMANLSQRMDQGYYRHRFVMGTSLKSGAPPSEQLHRQVYATFMDDRAGIMTREAIGVENIMWASDYPHPDSTSPHSQEVIQKQMGDIPQSDREKITRSNAIKLYKLDVK